ncbi:putative fructokinase [Candidatus Sulfopaludibacter sp. SbA4]|nr:putative fructokinase [Candidatus Sulfopaludibacter sp. SbA4]
MFGAIEAGGTKFVCAVGTGPGDLETIQIPTTSPGETIGAVVAFLRGRAGAELQAVGIASFGPLGLDPGSPSFGHITSTPKLEWRNFDFAGAVRQALGVPIGFDTDVNGAALGEARWGAAQGLTDFVYLTVGTGIGGGAVCGGRVVHGLVHPEMGHIRVPHDTVRDPYTGVCPYHRDCLEGLASGPSMEARWGRPASDLPPEHPAWTLEAHYLALGLVNYVCTLSPRRIVLGGGVMQQPHLFGLIRAELLELLNGYIQASEIIERTREFIVPPLLGSRAGVLGALVLAEQAMLCLI